MATDLLLTGRNAETLSRLVHGLSRPGRRVEGLAADLDTDSGREAVAAAADDFAVDLFMCNAGQGPFDNFMDADEAALRATVSANVMTPLVLLHRLLPGMLVRARTAGRRAGIIVTSSRVAFYPVPRLATYAASKAFSLSLTEALSAELSGAPVDLLALCPIATKSNFAEWSGYGPSLPGAQDPAEVARAALQALGRQRTLTLGPISGSMLTVPTLVRAGLAQAISILVQRGSGARPRRP